MLPALFALLLLFTGEVKSQFGPWRVLRENDDVAEPSGDGFAGDGQALTPPAPIEKLIKRKTGVLNYEDIFRYWRRADVQYTLWKHSEFEAYSDEYKARLKARDLRFDARPDGDEALLDVYYFLRNRTKIPTAPGWTPERDRCAPGCSQAGTCHQELGRCDCPRGRQGPTCTEPLQTTCGMYCQEPSCYRVLREWCLSECSGRGTCVGSYCHCWPGYFGADCSLSIDYEGTDGPPNRTVILQGLGYRPNARGPKFYVYELPPQLASWGLWLDRPINTMLWERLTSLRLRTADPEEADYFFIPGCGRACNKWNPIPKRIAYIKEHYLRYWERRGGRDHLMTQTGDWGRCELQGLAPVAADLDKLTLLTHWGIAADRTGQFPFKERFSACHKPDQDIVIPVLCRDVYEQLEWNYWHPRWRGRPPEKKYLASFAGSVCSWGSDREPPCPKPHYSFGVREALWRQLRGRPGFAFEQRVNNMGLFMAESEFCVAPTGAGYGKRNVASTSAGCMPLVISDHVAQPFEPFVDWNEFGLWIPEGAINDTEAILRELTPEHKAEKMAKLTCMSRRLAYTTVFGGLYDGDDGRSDAVAALLTILGARARHPGLADWALMDADPELAAFFACPLPGDQPPAASALNGSQAAAVTPPSSTHPKPPPAPLAAQHMRIPDAPDGAAYPRRTVTTLEWLRARNAAVQAAEGQQGRQQARAGKRCGAKHKGVVAGDAAPSREGVARGAGTAGHEHQGAVQDRGRASRAAAAKATGKGTAAARAASREVPGRMAAGVLRSRRWLAEGEEALAAVQPASELAAGDDAGEDYDGQTEEDHAKQQAADEGEEEAGKGKGRVEAVEEQHEEDGSSAGAGTGAGDLNGDLEEDYSDGDANGEEEQDAAGAEGPAAGAGAEGQGQAPGGEAAEAKAGGVTPTQAGTTSGKAGAHEQDGGAAAAAAAEQEDEAEGAAAAQAAAAEAAASEEDCGGAQGGQAPPADLPPSRPELCLYFPHSVVHRAHEEGHDKALAAAMSMAGQAVHLHHRYCSPHNSYRPGSFLPGGSATCPPMGPILKCAVLW